MLFKARTLLLIAALCCLPLAWHGTACASAPAEMPVIIPKEPPAKKPKPATCPVKGVLHCSEYGSRYKEPVLVVFVDAEGDKYNAAVNDKDGGFETLVPAGSSLKLLVEFQGKGIEIGRYDAPKVCKPDPEPAIDIYHPGSMLELIWEVRDGGYANVDVKIKSE